MIDGWFVGENGNRDGEARTREVYRSMRGYDIEVDVAFFVVFVF